MQVRDMGLRDLAGPLADAHLDVTPDRPTLGEELHALRTTGKFPVSDDARALRVQVFEVDFRDENHPKSDFVVFLGRERIWQGTRQDAAGLDVDAADDRWHLSINGRYRVPTWEECVAIAHRIRDGVVFVLGVPPRSWWLNKAENCLHLWELKDEHLEAMWRGERQADTPS